MKTDDQVKQKDQLPITSVIARPQAAPQGGLSCPFGAIHLLAISWWCLPFRTLYQEIAASAFVLLAMTEVVRRVRNEFTRY